MIFILLIISLLAANFWVGYKLGVSDYKNHILDNLKKNYSDYEMFRIMFHAGGLEIKSIEERCPLIKRSKHA